MVTFKSFWIQCNKCRTPYTNPQGIRLYCTSCSHLLCERCFRHPCPICLSSCNKVLVSPDMPLNVKLYFEEIPELLGLLQKILKFQFEQQTFIITSRWDIFEKIRKAKQAKAALDKRNRQLQETIKADLKQFFELKQFIQEHERRKAQALERERMAQNYMPRAPMSRPVEQFFNGSFNADVLPSSGHNIQPDGIRGHTPDFEKGNFSRISDSGHISDYSPASRTPVHGRSAIPARIGSGIARSSGPLFSGDLRKRVLSPYGGRGQSFRTPQQRFGHPRYRLD